MIEVLSKPTDQIGIFDIESLVASKVPEGEQVEFKERLPAKGDSIDPWETGEDKIGDYAKNALLKEAVGFANAYGGAVLLGIRQSKANPPVTARIVPMQRCADLTERLKQVFRDRVEPQLPRIDIFAVPTERKSGVVIIRVGRSRLAPHRVTGTLVCPIRRSDRCEEMSMREIQDMTLNVARGLERLEKRLSERADRFRQEFERLETPHDAWGIRLTAAPIGDEIRIDRVFRHPGLAEEFNELWRKVSQSSNGHELKGLGYNGFTLPWSWKPRLRATRAEPSFDLSNNLPRNSYRELHCDGLIELGCVSVCSSSLDGERTFSCPLPPDLPVDMFANLAVWADHVRRRALAPTAEYALEVEIIAKGGSVVVSNPGSYVLVHYDALELQSGPILFPRYSLGDPDEILNLLASFHRDFWNSLGSDVGAAEGKFSIQDWPG